MQEKRSYKLKPTVKTVLVDTATPVSLFCRLRDKFPHCLLLESADYRGNENSYSFLCFKPIAGFKVANDRITSFYPDGTENVAVIKDYTDVQSALEAFVDCFEVEHDEQLPQAADGLFGYIAYDSIQYWEDIELKQEVDPNRHIPEVLYHVYEHVLAINHYNNEMHIIHNRFGDNMGAEQEDPFDSLQYLTNLGCATTYPFTVVGTEESNFTDSEYGAVVAQCQKHIKRGDVFQIVPSRRYSHRFKGDDLNVYRALRSINPSPYLFYFDYGDFRIFGSSPEAQLVIKDGEAEVHPIAGTYRRTGDDATDTLKAEALRDDPKENAEHVMLVDLARNDLSKHCHKVQVKSYKEIQYFSHVIHLVSKVSGQLTDRSSVISVLADTFPAGTLSGAPKYRAMELIDLYEKGKRYFYGGGIGFLGFNGDCNHAIMIRSFLSKNSTLYYQAGAGVVADSVPDNEVQETKNKLMALKNAIAMAERL
ncbi:anthranilate synthase component I family protein [Oligoflexia bacterium]|nr:anthranilate synthase component I family protein [Oligoflexia bacterium]